MFDHFLVYRLSALSWHVAELEDIQWGRSFFPWGSQNTACGKFRFLLVLFGIGWLFIKPKTSCIVSVLAAGIVHFENSDARAWPLRTWPGWFTKFAFSSQNTLSGTNWATSFVQSGPCLSNILSSGCIATSLRMIARTGTQNWLCTGMSILAEALTNRDGVLWLLSSPVHGLASSCGACRCTNRPRWKIVVVIPTFSYMISLPIRVFRTSLSRKSAVKIMKAANDLHKNKLTRTL